MLLSNIAAAARATHRGRPSSVHLTRIPRGWTGGEVKSSRCRSSLRGRSKGLCALRLRSSRRSAQLKIAVAADNHDSRPDTGMAAHRCRQHYPTQTVRPHLVRHSPPTPRNHRFCAERLLNQPRQVFPSRIRKRQNRPLWSGHKHEACRLGHGLHLTCKWIGDSALRVDHKTMAFSGSLWNRACLSQDDIAWFSMTGKTSRARFVMLRASSIAR